MARSVSQSHANFATWLLAGFSAAFTLILVNLDVVSKFVELSSVKFAVLLFLVSLIIAVLQRWISTVLQAGFQSGDEGAKIDAHLNSNGLVVNQEVLLREIEKASFYPAKYFMKIQYDKIRAGDLTVAGRQNAKLAQIQGLLMLSQVIIAVTSIVVLVLGLNT